MKYIFLLIFTPLNLFSQESWNLNLLGSLDYLTSQGNDIWGWVDSTNNEYALVGLRDGLSVVDITNPTIPTERFFIEDSNTVWRDIKTWKNYAYVTSEANTGLLIVDLTDMSGKTYLHLNKFFSLSKSDSISFTSAHNLYIDEKGICYVFGAGGYENTSDGVILLDVKNNPIRPTFLGEWNNYYLHDGMVRGDTLWAAAINEGKFFVINVSEKSNPYTIASHSTPFNFTHNVWISDNGNYLYTTDEKSDAFITVYNVRDLNNIEEVYRIQSNPGSGSVPHNTIVDGNFLITSYYRDGTIIHDITHPDNIVQVAYYDSYSGTGDGFDGCWGTYPYLPSGNIISSDRNSVPGGFGTAKLSVYQRNFKQACYLKGKVINGVINDPTEINPSVIDNAKIQVLSTTINTNTNLMGFYKTASVNSGTFEVMFSAEGFKPDTVTVNFINGETIELDAILYPNFNVFIPKAFSPNKKGLNDSFGPIINFEEDILNYEKNLFYTIKIYNKWHEIIFNKDNQFWDGKVKKEVVSQGTYYYDIMVYDIQQTSFNYKGMVTVF